MDASKSFAERLASACDQRSDIPKMNKGAGRLTFLKSALEQRGVPVSLQSVSRWYGGVLIPRDKHLIPLAEILNCTPEWLRFGAGEQEAAPPSKRDLTRHRFQLRPGLEVSFDLPSDLTEKEADRLARMIRTIPLV